MSLQDSFSTLLGSLILGDLVKVAEVTEFAKSIQVDLADLTPSEVAAILDPFATFCLQSKLVGLALVTLIELDPSWEDFIRSSAVLAECLVDAKKNLKQGTLLHFSFLILFLGVPPKELSSI
jgi:hypothetical protein